MKIFLFPLLIAITFISAGCTLGGNQPSNLANNNGSKDTASVLSSDPSLLDKYKDFSIFKVSMIDAVNDYIMATGKDYYIVFANGIPGFANGTSSSKKITNINEAKRLLAETYAHFPHFPITTLANHSLSDYINSDMHFAFVYFDLKNDPAFSLFVKNTASGENPNPTGQFKYGTIDSREINNVYIFRQWITDMSECGGKGSKGFFNGEVTKDSQFIIMGYGCVDVAETNRLDVVTYQKDSLVGYIWKPEVFNGTNRP